MYTYDNCNNVNKFVKVHILTNKRNGKTQHTQFNENQHKLMTSIIYESVIQTIVNTVSQVSTELIQLSNVTLIISSSTAFHSQPFPNFHVSHFPPPQHCAAVSISRSFHYCIFVSPIPFPLFHLSHFQRPNPTPESLAYPYCVTKYSVIVWTNAERDDVKHRS